MKKTSYHYQMAGTLDAYDMENLRRLRKMSGHDEDAELLALQALDAAEGSSSPGGDFDER